MDSYDACILLDLATMLSVGSSGMGGILVTLLFGGTVDGMGVKFHMAKDPHYYAS